MKNIKQFKLKDNVECIRFLDNKKEKFELEFNLEQGTSFNTFFVIENDCLIIIHPPEINNFDSFLKIINTYIEEFIPKKINIITGHINPKIVDTIKKIKNLFNNLILTCSVPGKKLICELWEQKKPGEEDELSVSLPDIEVIKKEVILEFKNNTFQLIPAPTARWPGGLIVFEKND